MAAKEQISQIFLGDVTMMKSVEVGVAKVSEKLQQALGFQYSCEFGDSANAAQNYKILNTKFSLKQKRV